MKWRPSLLLLLIGFCALTRCGARQYHLIRDAAPWLQAQSHCRERYTDLATVENIEEMNQLVNTALASQDSAGGVTGKAWIGLHDDLSSWRWSLSDAGGRGDAELQYRNWHSEQPDNFQGDQMCVRMRSGGTWEDSQCTLRDAFVCYDGREGASQRFVFIDEERSWPDALKFCRKQHTDLAFITDEEENQKIQLLLKNNSAWIGLYRGRQWSDQSASTFRNWRSGQPDNEAGTQGCTAVDLGNAGVWSDESCNRTLAFVCYGEKKETEQVSSTTNPKQTTASARPSTEVTAPNHLSTPLVDQTQSGPRHVVKVTVRLAATTHQSEDDIRELMLKQFLNLLIAHGLPESVKMRVLRSSAEKRTG